MNKKKRYINTELVSKDIKHIIAITLDIPVKDVDPLFIEMRERGEMMYLDFEQHIRFGNNTYVKFAYHTGYSCMGIKKFNASWFPIYDLLPLMQLRSKVWQEYKVKRKVKMLTEIAQAQGVNFEDIPTPNRPKM